MIKIFLTQMIEKKNMEREEKIIFMTKKKKEKNYSI